MSTVTVRRRYRARVATLGAALVEGNVDFVLDLGELVEPPVAHGSVVHPLFGATEMQPFTVEAIDIESVVTDSFTVEERNRAIGRLIDVQWDEWDFGAAAWEDSWTTYVVGRCSEFGQGEGSGKYQASIGDESWKIRNRVVVFTENDTTQLWPAGTRYAWRGFRQAWTADGFRETSDGNTHWIRMTAGGPTPTGSGIGGAKYQGREIRPELIQFIRKDALPRDQWMFGGAVTRGNFEHVRVNYAGVDYEVVSFGITMFESLEEPTIAFPQSEFRTVTIFALVYSVSTPPATGEAFVWAPTHPPEPGFPLHLGVESASHEWGNAGGWLHPAELTRRYWEAAGVLYNDADLTALEADLSFPAIAPDVEEVPADPEKWIEDHVWQGNFLVAGHDLQGRRTLLDLRPPREIPLTAPVLDVTNSVPGEWSFRGDEMRNSIRFRFRNISEPEEIGTPWSLILGQPNQIALPPGGPGIIMNPDPNQNIRLDNFVATDYLSDAYEAEGADSTIPDSGRRELIVDQRAALDPKTRRIQSINSLITSGKGTQVDEVVLLLNPALLATFQDGSLRGRITVNRELGETIKEGDILILDKRSLKLAFPNGRGALNPGIGPQNPTDPGNVPPLETGPTLGALVLNSDLSITAPVATIPAGQTARVEYATGDYPTTPPDPESQAWVTPEGGTRTTTGDVTIPIRPRDSSTWVRISGEVDGIRVTDYSTPVEVEVAAQAAFIATRLVIADDGTVSVSWTPSALTLGVKLLWEVVDPGAAPTYPSSAHFNALTTFSATLPDVPEIGEVIAVKFEAYPGWTGTEVSGTLGETVIRTAQRRSVLAELTIPTTLGNFLQFTSGAYPARNNYFRTHTYVGVGQPGPDSIDGDVWIRPPA